mgnify:CR=1 FL=1
MRFSVRRKLRLFVAPADDTERRQVLRASRCTLLDTSDAEGAGGYARAQSDEFLAKQRELLAARVRAADAVISTPSVPTVSATSTAESGKG